MSLPTRFGVGQPSWYTNSTMPNYEDYANDPTGYEAAVKAWVQQQNGTTPAFQPSHGIAGPNGESGWTMAGNDNPNLNTLTPGEYLAQLLNHRQQQAGMHPGSPDAKMFELAMISRNQVRPEEMQGAYNAAIANNSGPTPVLNDAALKFFEDVLGYGAPKAVPGVSGTPPPSAGGRPTTLPGGITAGGKPGSQAPVGGTPKGPPTDIPRGPGPVGLPPGAGSGIPYPPGFDVGPAIEPWLMPGGGGVPPTAADIAAWRAKLADIPQPDLGNVYDQMQNKNPRPPIYGGY